MKEALAKILEEGVVPVIRVSSAQEAFEVAKAIHDGGISVIEVTMTVPGAMDVIKEVSQKFGKKVLLGAGTVLVAPTSVGDGGRTGAGAIVTRAHPVPPGETYVGVPARPLKSPSTPKRKGPQNE